MPFKLMRNDITKMQVDAIVNTANEEPIYSTGVDTAIYHAAGEEELLAERRKIGRLEEGQVAITPAFKLQAKYIIHAVSPLYINGKFGEEEKLRSCYRESLHLAHQHDCKSIAFPLISTGGFGYPKEEGMRVAVDEINAFLLHHEMLVYLVVFDTKSTELALHLQPALEAYIDHHYVCDMREIEYGDRYFDSVRPSAPGYDAYRVHRREIEAQTQVCREETEEKDSGTKQITIPEWLKPAPKKAIVENIFCQDIICETDDSPNDEEIVGDDYYAQEYERALAERIKHLSDTFQEYLLYLIESKGMTNAEVYKRSIITKQTFSKIKNNPNYHPDKSTAMRLCVGAQLSMDETKDLLARAGYALSPCDMRDIIFSFYIENQIYDMLEIDIRLEEYGLPCFIE